MSLRASASLVSDVVRGIERRILNHFMDLLIMSALYCYGGRISGYDVIKYLQLKYHFLPSSGTVYSCLYSMEREGLLRGRTEWQKKDIRFNAAWRRNCKGDFNGKELRLNASIKGESRIWELRTIFRNRHIEYSCN